MRNTTTPHTKEQIIDVSGAGDAVIATAALALAKKLRLSYFGATCQFSGWIILRKSWC